MRSGIVLKVSSPRKSSDLTKRRRRLNHLKDSEVFVTSRRRELNHMSQSGVSEGENEGPIVCVVSVYLREDLRIR